ncbi:jumonji superfamily protein [Crucibulum laeve]|uniref:[histone H3]-trimethyl-L-lysine(4) demethylase n=1 Tax=Crucibulum laeve TaxID=68775 RepID=A0A5C3MF21_9AGAR|nr:jumonji superfamily protein [Crucibulum laeve]
MHGGSSASTPRGTPSRRGKSPRFSADSPSQAGSSTFPSNFANKPATTFTSSINIRVEGAVPIEIDSSHDSEPADAELEASQADSKRAPRKSKTEALAALNSHARSASVGPEDSENHTDLTEKYLNAPPIPVSPILNLSTVKTASPRTAVNTDLAPRPFGLEDCLEFYPTAEEFKDPMAYVGSIADRAKEYGICKIVPPAEWKMPFVTDTESFRFKTRLMRLNSIEASSRAKLNFLEQLYRFHKQQGNPRVVVPTINHKPLDLWLLRKEVQKMGGYEMVTKGKKWSDLGRVLGYRGIPGLSTQIKNSYTRVILPYEHFCERTRNSPAMSPIIARDAHLKTHSSIHSVGKLSRLSTSVTTPGGTSPPGSPLTATSSPLSEPPDESDSKDANGKPSSSRPRRSTRMGSEQSTPKKSTINGLLPSPVIPPPVFYDKQREDSKIGTPEVRTPLVQALPDARPMTNGNQQNCEICHKKNRGEEMLLCDGCDCGFHMFCLDPPLDTIPKEQWFCYTCLSGTGGDFGFDEGEEHSLSSFQARDLEFRRLWFETHPPAETKLNLPEFMTNRIGDVSVSEYNMEEEFWRLVQSQHDTVEIEYGADVHSTTHGSAMPTMETHPLNPYSKDPWNLNNIPILPDSLLRFIKSDISGMTVPWTYVGMAFSTFCWHNEDHYTYSVNFMHWGETKTWYGIPGDDAEKFEAAIKGEAPDLFEAQPDLLFQLVTLMNPQRVKEAGVRVYACNQRAGEFVITFPKAYHAGFNHGLNFNEAVNFALPDWLPYGRDCVQRYREHRKLPVFSHDELLITITQQSQSIKTAMWLINSLKEMTDREMSDRQKARSLGIPEILEEEDRPEDQYQCTICKAFCYLSQITCQCTTKVVCVDHLNLLCENRMANHLTLRKRFSDEELLDIQAKVAERAGIPAAWKGKLNKLLLESARPALRSLRALLAEGDRINYHLPELASLRKCVTRANEWVDSANSFIIRKQSRKRSRRSRGRPSAAEIAAMAAAAAEDPGDRPDRGLDDLYALLREVETLGFDCPEIGVLRTLAQQAEETKLKALALLNTPPAEQERHEFLADCKRLLLQGSSLNVLLDELMEVEKIVDREQLVKELEEKLDDTEATLTLEEVRQLLTRARTCNLPADNKHMQLLEARQREGDDWEERARNVLEQPIKTIDELDDFASLDSSIPIDPTVLDRLMSARAKAKDFEKQAKSWLSPGAETSKPRVQDVLRLANRAEKDFSIAAIHDLKRTAEIASDLESRCDRALRNKYHKAEKENAFETFEQWKAYAQEHLTMFTLPSFEKLDAQLKLHSKWVKDLPWYCKEHGEPHGQSILEDVLECTRTEDDLPPTDEYFTCICNTPVRPPPPGVVSDAVQCDHCFARFHGECAKNGGSCPFCDHHHWNGAIHKERSWHFCYLPTILAKAPEITRNYSEDYKQLEIIIHRVDRLSAIIGQFLSFTSQPANQRPDYIPQVRHYMRKLYKIQFSVSPNPDVSFGLDLAGLHRILAGRPPLVRPKKRRRPRFTFGQDTDADWTDGTRCICRGRTTYLLNYPTVKCDSCHRLYHAGCVFYQPDLNAPVDHAFICPLCCLRKGKTYQYSEVRVTPIERTDPDLYVHTQEMLKTFSRDIIYKKMPRPYTQTLFVELKDFQPGMPDEGAVNSSSARSMPSSHHASNKPSPSHAATAHQHQITLPMHNTAAPVGYSNGLTASNAHVPPPPPWSRWGTMSTPSRPPSTNRRQPNDRSSGTPQPSGIRKRKHMEDISAPPEAGPSTKRRAAPPAPPPMPISPQPHPAHTPVQTLSPSLAMIVSPTNTNVQTSPRTAYVPPPLRNGSSSSPTLPPVKSLMMNAP